MVMYQKDYKVKYDGKEIKRIPVRCINNGKEFKSLTDAAMWCGGMSYAARIKNSCVNKSAAGKDIVTKEKLYWEFV